ncbi:MAG: hypothetical protein K6E40_17000 [Desulfovibrio sp.]|nr:hypothetical protein [Desulfovibrio sp.]
MHELLPACSRSRARRLIADFASVRSRGMSAGCLRPDLRFGSFCWFPTRVADWIRMPHVNVIDFKA